MNDVTPGFSFKVMKLVVDYRMNTSIVLPMSCDGFKSGVCVLVKQRRA